MLVVGIGLLEWLVPTDLRTAQPIAYPGRFEQAGFVVGVRSCPARIGRVASAMNEFEEVSRRVVLILFDIRSHGFAVARVRQVDAGNVVVRSGGWRQGHVAAQT
jgi:hypothetical protein